VKEDHRDRKLAGQRLARNPSDGTGQRHRKSSAATAGLGRHWNQVRIGGALAAITRRSSYARARSPSSRNRAKIHDDDRDLTAMAGWGTTTAVPAAKRTVYLQSTSPNSRSRVDQRRAQQGRGAVYVGDRRNIRVDGELTKTVSPCGVAAGRNDEADGRGRPSRRDGAGADLPP